MDQKIKNYLGIAVIAALLLLAYAALNYVGLYGKSIQPSSYRSFSVMAEGKVVAKPDVAEFTFSVITEGGKNLSDLEKKNTDAANSTIDSVKSQGVDAKDIQTTGYNIQPRYQYYNCGPQIYDPSSAIPVKPCPPSTIVGYTISQTVTVKARDFSKAGDILQGVVASGANNVSQLNFQIDDPTSLQNEARMKAIEKAKTQAELVARAGGFSLGGLFPVA